MGNTAAAIWSAIAASFAAVAAFTIMLIHVWNRRESVRPELVLTGWGRTALPEGKEMVTFTNIRNVGKGVALHVMIDSMQEVDERIIAYEAPQVISIIPVNESESINGQVHLHWKAGTDDAKYDAIDIKVRMRCLDSHDRRHETVYSLLAATQPGTIVAPESMVIATGVALLHRRHISPSTLSRRLRQRYDRVKKYLSHKAPDLRDVVFVRMSGTVTQAPPPSPEPSKTTIADDRDL